MPLSCKTTIPKNEHHGCLVRLWIGLWHFFLSLLMQFIIVARSRLIQKQRTFFLSTKPYINSCLLYFTTHFGVSWHSCVCILSILLLFHAFLDNGTFLDNGNFFKMKHVNLTKFVGIMAWTLSNFLEALPKAF